MSDVKALARQYADEASRKVDCDGGHGDYTHDRWCEEELTELASIFERALLKYGEMREAAATARFVDMFRDCGLDQAANALEAERASKPAEPVLSKSVQRRLAIQRPADTEEEE